MVGLEWLPPRLLLDGAVGTALISRGLDLEREPPEAWNLRRPDAVGEVHRRYAEAGCGAVQTNTFGGTRTRLRRFGLEGAVVEINRRAVDLARSAVPPNVLVIGSIGPTGAVPPPQGDADLTELEESFAEQAGALAGAGVELLHLETFYHPKELRAALRGARAGAPGMAVVASFACNRNTAGGYSSAFGFPPEALITVAVEEQADGLGINCGLVPEDMLPLLEKVKARTTRPIFAKPIIAPQSGPPLYPDEFGAGVKALFDVGARAVGGCCGTSPADLAAAHTFLRP